MSERNQNAINLADIMFKDIMIIPNIKGATESLPKHTSLELLEPHLQQVLFLAVWLECFLFV